MDAADTLSEEEARLEDEKDAMRAWSKARSYACAKGCEYLADEFASEVLMTRFVNVSSESIKQIFSRFWRKRYGVEEGNHPTHPDKVKILRPDSTDAMESTEIPEPYEEPVNTISELFLNFEGVDRAILVLSFKWDLEPYEIAEAFGWGILETERKLARLVERAAQIAARKNRFS